MPTPAAAAPYLGTYGTANDHVTVAYGGTANTTADALLVANVTRNGTLYESWRLVAEPDVKPISGMRGGGSPCAPCRLPRVDMTP